MIFIPILAVVYYCAFLVAATVLKKRQRAILWTGALIPFFSILLLIGLGLFLPRDFGSILGTFIFLGSSGLMACMAEGQFPVRKKALDNQSISQKQSSDSDAKFQTDQIKLSARLDTERARDVFST